MKNLGCLLLLVFTAAFIGTAVVAEDKKSAFVAIAVLSLVFGGVLYAAGTIKGWFSKAERKSKNKGSSTTARTDDDDEDYDDDDDDDRLQAWKKAKRTNLQLVDVRGKKETLLLKAAKRSREIKIQYHGGRDVGTIRKVIPRQVFKVEGYRSTYLLAYDFTHDEDRTFNLNDFEIL